MGKPAKLHLASAKPAPSALDVVSWLAGVREEVIRHLQEEIAVLDQIAVDSESGKLPQDALRQWANAEKLLAKLEGK